jgi:DNA-binding transcriptional ArsR family regulator
MATATLPSVDQTFAALADPTRLEIVTRLSRGVASVSELAEPFDMSLRAVLKHIEVLEDAGIVRTMKAGRVRRCELDRKPIEHVSRWIEQVGRRWERRLDRLEDYVRSEQP